VGRGAVQAAQETYSCFFTVERGLAGKLKTGGAEELAFIWLGLPADDSDSWMAELKRIGEASLVLTLDERRKKIDAMDIVDVRNLLQHPGATPFFRRPYWKRAWVQQDTRTISVINLSSSRRSDSGC
jgi:hypothetical protein